MSPHALDFDFKFSRGFASRANIDHDRRDLARLHRQSATLAATLATRLRLTPHSKLGKNQPTDGELPVT